jgi:MFS family permease
MTQMTSSAEIIVLVQTASMLPIMLTSLAAGAIADMYDRRMVGLFALSVAFAGATALSVLAHLGLIGPVTLLAFCFIIGTGMALFGPAWQASVSEQVSSQALPAAIALNTISYNIARSFGPAIGGVIVSLGGSVAAFICNALLYVPLLIVLYFWRRTKEVSRLPPERLRRAVISGVRYVIHSPPIRVVLARTFLVGIIGGSITALMPLVARNLLGGEAQIYGIMLGAFGMGAVIGALNIPRIRFRFSSESSVRVCALTMGAALVVVAESRNPFLTGSALVVAGAAWMVAIALFNIAIQLSAPRWVAGRALAVFQAAISGGVAIGSWMWGQIAQSVGVDIAILLSGVAMAVSMLSGLWLVIPSLHSANDDAVEAIADPEVRLPLTARSGPIVVEIEYRVDPRKAREFYRTMQEVQLSRQRNGAYGWSLARELADRELWTERYHCPTWLDYLRQRNRPTQSERLLQERALQFHLGPEAVRIRRMLERPFGSVRWKEETPDRARADVLPIADPSAGH